MSADPQAHRPRPRSRPTPMLTRHAQPPRERPRPRPTPHAPRPAPPLTPNAHAARLRRTHHPPHPGPSLTHVHLLAEHASPQTGNEKRAARQRTCFLVRTLIVKTHSAALPLPQTAIISTESAPIPCEDHVCLTESGYITDRERKRSGSPLSASTVTISCALASYLRPKARCASHNNLGALPPPLSDVGSKNSPCCRRVLPKAALHVYSFLDLLRIAALFIPFYVRERGCVRALACVCLRFNACLREGAWAHACARVRLRAPACACVRLRAPGCARRSRARCVTAYVRVCRAHVCLKVGRSVLEDRATHSFAVCDKRVDVA
eukprot:6173719-Pleurochrysis_carterae.AAC.2